MEARRVHNPEVIGSKSRAIGVGLLCSKEGGSMLELDCNGQILWILTRRKYSYPIPGNPREI